MFLDIRLVPRSCNWNNSATSCELIGASDLLKCKWVSYLRQRYGTQSSFSSLELFKQSRCFLYYMDPKVDHSLQKHSRHLTLVHFILFHPCSFPYFCRIRYNIIVLFTSRSPRCPFPQTSRNPFNAYVLLNQWIPVLSGLNSSDICTVYSCKFLFNVTSICFPN
jgi:hypothetical protein